MCIRDRIFDRNPTYQDSSNLAPDSSCLTEIPLNEALIEYRFHLEDNLDTREVSCEMGIPGTHVDYRRGRSRTIYVKLAIWDRISRDPIYLTIFYICIFPNDLPNGIYYTWQNCHLSLWLRLGNDFFQIYDFVNQCII